MIVLLLIMNQTEFFLVHKQNENCNYDHIPFNLKEICFFECKGVQEMRLLLLIETIKFFYF